jgi:hypothetical protein
MSVQDLADNIYTASVSYSNNLFTQDESAIESTNQQMAQLNSKLNQCIYLASALTVVPPNPGDRFSITLVDPVSTDMARELRARGLEFPQM